MSDEAVVQRPGTVGTTEAAPEVPEPDRVLTDPINWAAITHRDLFMSVHKDNEPAKAQELAREWTGLADTVDEAATGFEDAVRQSGAGWQGEAAEAARAHLLELVRQGADLAATSRGIGACLVEQSTVMERAKQAMPEPLNFDLDQAMRTGFTSGGLQGLTMSAVALKSLSDASNARHQQAVDVMTTMEADSRTVDGKVPGFAQAGLRTRSQLAPEPVLAPENAPQKAETTPREAAQPLVSSGAAAAPPADPPTLAMRPVESPAAGAPVPSDVPPAVPAGTTAASAATAPPQYTGPQHTGPQYTGPQYTGPQYTSPQSAPPQYAPPQYTGMSGSVPNASTPMSYGGGAAPVAKQWAQNPSAPSGQNPTQAPPGNAVSGTVRMPRPGKPTQSTDAPTKRLRVQRSGSDQSQPGMRPEDFVPGSPIPGGPIPGGPGAEVPHSGGYRPDGLPPNNFRPDGLGVQAGGPPGLPVPPPPGSPVPPGMGSPVPPGGEPPKVPFNGSAGATFSPGGGASAFSPESRPLAPGGTSAATPGVGTAGAAAAAASQAGAPGGGGAPGTTGQGGGAYGMPMGGGGAPGMQQQGSRDAERQSRSYLKEEGIFEHPDRGAPVVFGEKFKKKQD
ncbi:PPE domain-containing protein [Saccharopolyspora sp. 5N708]|uniref:PPE domain-containing protein n=1 Tax=Saccharopolyspora sp. 5N708 TaxID=3457424 RepID=UPI003FCF82D0